jgi:hydrogenase small subunit
MGVEIVNKTIERGGYILAVEGAVPGAMPRACHFGDEPFGVQLQRAARQAKAVLSVGSCAAFGGIPAAENNPTGAVSVPGFLKQAGVATPVVSIPGCPVHPDWLVGSIVHILKFGLPPLDERGCPIAFCGRLVHDQCPRFADYERENFAKAFSEEGCMFKLGCQGPLTKADCNLRLWNGGTNTCIRSGAPCIGCASASFAAKAGFPFYLQQGETGKVN